MLGCFSADQPTFSLSDLSDNLALPKPTVFRIASVMQGLGFLDKATPSGDYMLGLASLRHADALLASIPIREFALPVMEWMRDQVNETVILSLREGDFRYNIDSVECTHSIVQAQQIGTPIPLYAGAASRVMLAAMPADELENYLRRVQLAAFSSTTITDIGELKAQIKHAQKTGFVTTSGEFTPGGHAVASLIKAPPLFGTVALHVSIPHVRHSNDLIRESIACLRDGIDKISDGL